MDRRLQPVSLRHPQRVLRQSAAPRPQLDIVDRLFAAGIDPHIGQPQPDQFAKHLADFGRGDEVPGAAQRVF